TQYSCSRSPSLFYLLTSTGYGPRYKKDCAKIKYTERESVERRIIVRSLLPLTERTINKLTERLRLIEMRLPSKASGDLSAFIVKGGEKKVHAKKEKSEKPERKCFKCHQPGHIAKNCPNKKAT
ncbi:unnamed protein product, partial [Tenebrio molitor]